jgi:DNA-binding NarL/FixJ family response regulator
VTNKPPAHLLVVSASPLVRAGLQAVLGDAFPGVQITPLARLPSAAEQAGRWSDVEGVVADIPEPGDAAGSPDEPPSWVEPLTGRELEVFTLLAQGLHNQAIAEQLGISRHTAKFHVSQILAKLGAASRTEAVGIGLRLGLVGV